MTPHETLHAAILSNDKARIKAALKALTGGAQDGTGYPLSMLKQIATAALRHNYDGSPRHNAELEAMHQNALMHINEPPPDQPRDKGRWVAGAVGAAAGAALGAAGMAAYLGGGAGKAVQAVSTLGKALGRGLGKAGSMVAPGGQSLAEAAKAISSKLAWKSTPGAASDPYIRQQLQKLASGLAASGLVIHIVRRANPTPPAYNCVCMSCWDSLGKYPPAKPGALELEPPEAADGVADAAPKI